MTSVHTEHSAGFDADADADADADVETAAAMVMGLAFKIFTPAR
jgi:hypothetical protein